MAVPCPADTPNDLQQQLTQTAAEVKDQAQTLCDYRTPGVCPTVDAAIGGFFVPKHGIGAAADRRRQGGGACRERRRWFLR